MKKRVWRVEQVSVNDGGLFGKADELAVENALGGSSHGRVDDCVGSRRLWACLDAFDYLLPGRGTQPADRRIRGAEMNSAPLFEDTISDAIFSPCRRYRYLLSRIWDAELPLLNFCMLNPSTADEIKNDPTVERCERRAHMWNYGGLLVTNIFAWRSTDPGVLYDLEDPVGPDNDEHIVEAAHRSQVTICAWGLYGVLYGRGEAVRKRLAMFTVPYVLRLTKVSKRPEHPLYIPYSVKPQPWANYKDLVDDQRKTGRRNHGR